MGGKEGENGRNWDISGKNKLSQDLQIEDDFLFATQMFIHVCDVHSHLFLNFQLINE